MNRSFATSGSPGARAARARLGASKAVDVGFPRISQRRWRRGISRPQTAQGISRPRRRRHPEMPGRLYSASSRLVSRLRRSAAIKRIGDSKIATFVGWKIIEQHGAAVLDDFMAALTSDDLAATHPVMVLRKRLDEHEAAHLAPRTSVKKKQLLTSTKILALVIKAFNLMLSEVQVRRLDPRMDDSYPRFEDYVPEPVPEAAAAQ